jgi:succinoglycan biosynthesis transport protein ExoP
LEAVTALPELASVPFLASFSKKRRNQKHDRSYSSIHSHFGPVVFAEINSPGVESYRALCSAILLSSARNSTKKLVITSASPSDGKSAVSRNLATALALRGRKVLLVDADLRCSSMQSQAGLKPGLSTMCATGAEFHPRYQPIPNLPNLHVVPAGIRPTDPATVLDSPRMQDLMAAWREEYDHIIVDTPPVLPFADALVLAASADGVILVVRSGVTRAKALLRAREVLERSGANILGFVMNAARKRASYYEYPKGYKPFSEKDRQSNSLH